MSTTIEIPNKAVELADIERLNHVSLLSEALALSEGSSDIEVLRVKKIWGRNLTITGDMLDDFVQNFKDNVYGCELQVNLSHVREGEAAGWIRNLYRKGDCLLATVEWTPLGQEKVASRQFRYTSSELELRHQHHETGDIVKNVLIGVALTNIPAVKGMEPVTLSEGVESFINFQESMDKVKSMYADLMKKKDVSKEDMTAFREACAEFKDDKEVKDMMSKVSGRSNNSEGGEGSEGGEAEGDKGTEGDAGAKAPEAKAQLAEQLKANGMVALSETALKQLQADAAAGRAAADELRFNKLSESVKSELCLSSDRKTGFRAKDAERVAKFLSALTAEQVAEFKALNTLVVTVDLSEAGVDAVTAPVGDADGSEKSEAQRFAEARTKAEALATSTGRSLTDCLSEVFEAMKLV